MNADAVISLKARQQGKSGSLARNLLAFWSQETDSKETRLPWPLFPNKSCSLPSSNLGEKNRMALALPEWRPEPSGNKRGRRVSGHVQRQREKSPVFWDESWPKLHEQGLVSFHEEPVYNLMLPMGE